MALEDLAMLRAVHGSTLLYPSDGTSAAALGGAMAECEGVVYMRTTRGAYPVLPDGTRALGLSPELRTPPLRATHVGVGTGHRARTQTTLYVIDLASNLACLLNACDLVSHSWKRQ